MNHNMTKNNRENKAQNQTATETQQTHTGSSQNRKNENTGC